MHLPEMSERLSPRLSGRALQENLNPKVALHVLTRSGNELNIFILALFSQGLERAWAFFLGNKRPSLFCTDFGPVLSKSTVPLPIEMQNNFKMKIPFLWKENPGISGLFVCAGIGKPAWPSLPTLKTRV